MPSIFDLLDQNSMINIQDVQSPSVNQNVKKRSVFDLLDQPQEEPGQSTQKVAEELSFIGKSGIEEGAQPQSSPFDDENELDRQIERGQAQATSRFIETLGGLPGDLQKFASNLFGFKVGPQLPGSQEIKEGIGKITKGYTLPKNEFEEKAGELVSDIASFATPGANAYSFARNIGIPLAGSFVKEYLKNSGSDEKNSTLAKIGTMVALDLMQARKGGAKKFASDLFNESERLVPKGASIPAKNIESSLKNLRKNLSLGGEKAPSTSKAIDQIDDILKQVKNGQIEVAELIARRKKLNESILEKGGFDIKLPKPIEKRLLSNLNEVKSKVIEGLEEYGKINPEFGKINRSANEAWQAYSQSNVISNFIQKNFNKTLNSKGAKLLFGLGGTGALAATTKSLVPIGGAAASLIGPYSAMKVAIRVSKSPTLRKYYQNVLISASKGNASEMARNLEILDNKLKQEEENSLKREKNLLGN